MDNARQKSGFICSLEETSMEASQEEKVQEYGRGEKDHYHNGNYTGSLSGDQISAALCDSFFYCVKESYTPKNPNASVVGFV